MSETGNDFPKLGINTQQLVDVVEAAIKEAKTSDEDFGAVNWGDIGVVDVEYRLSMLHPAEGPQAVVIVEEASPHCGLEGWLYSKIKDQFPSVSVECEW